ncbi:hypothetical protein [Rhizobium sp. SSA_523]|uniref:hypothetical protein n=1 Tax=Rhizobium sp. SSA_523 TaxID=2952477 RepID=UPI002090ECEE|nr:hypothetical protein [Rhizobium sp. SSA_523]MCO5733896.1 hypothetical protein [Rhizobium sp. SSA_523]WKC24839.1 hypothetical protein QTJ18_12535 [Rhizobium sp. SSA_523]
MVDDFSQIMQLLEAARQLADVNELPMLAYLVGMAKDEARANRGTLKENRHGRIKPS